MESANEQTSKSRQQNGRRILANDKARLGAAQAAKGWGIMVFGGREKYVPPQTSQPETRFTEIPAQVSQCGGNQDTRSPMRRITSFASA